MRKALLIAAASLAGLLLLAWIALPWISTMDWAQALMCKVIEEQVHSRVDFAVRFGEIRVGRSTAVTVKGLKVSKHGTIWLTAESLTVGPLFPGILGDERALGDIVVRDPHLWIRRDGEGRWNFPPRGAGRPANEKKPKKDASGEKPFVLPVVADSIVLENGFLHLRLAKASGRPAFSSDGPLEVSGALEPRWVRVDHLFAGADGASVQASGSATYTGWLDFSVKLSVPDPALLRAMAGYAPPYKNVDAALEISGHPTKNLRAAFDVSASGGPAAKGEASATLEPGGRSVRVSARFSNMDTRAFSGLDAVLSGKINVSAKGPGFSQREVSASLANSRIREYAIRTARVDARLDGPELEHADVEADLDGGRFFLQASGVLAGFAARAE
ncbi:MAG: hypothetical protein JRI97_03585, partial [Deltaproteobacteria bacterium]|nr:hypothetical protein [Deltaproteobacteria bacterium]